jgi:replicative DNA helicase
VIFLHRPDETNRDLIELIIGKQRNGPIDHTFLHAAMDKMRFAVTDERPAERVQSRGFGRNKIKAA